MFAVLWAIAAPVVVVATVVVLILYLVDTRSGRRNDSLLVSYFLLVVALAVVGGTAGYAGGISRSAVVGDVIPAALGLLGGLSVYLFGVQKNPSSVTPIVVIVFAFTLMRGFAAGAEDRDVRQTFERLEEGCINLYMDTDTMDAERLKLADLRHGRMCQEIFAELMSRLRPGPRD